MKDDQLCIALQIMEGNCDTLFDLVNCETPPSISKHGNLRSDTKADLLRCIKNDSTAEFAGSMDAIFIDGAMIHILRTTSKHLMNMLLHPPIH